MAKTDTANGLIEAFAVGEIRLPDCVRLRDQDYQFLQQILPARARVEWDGPSLIAAGHLARCFADLEEQQQALDLEGAVQKNDKGTQIANPRFSVVESLTRRAMALQRSLQIDPRQSSGQARDNKGKRVVDAVTTKAKRSIKDDLIPGIH